MLGFDRFVSFVCLRSRLGLEVSIDAITKLAFIFGDRADRLLNCTAWIAAHLLLYLVDRLLHLLYDGALFLDDKVILALHVILPLDDLLQIVDLLVEVAIVTDVLLVGVLFVVTEGVIIISELAHILIIVYLAHNDLLSNYYRINANSSL